MLGADDDGIDLGTAQWAMNHNEAAGLGTDTLAGSAWLYLPLTTPMRARGVLAVKPEDVRLLLVPEQRQQLETFAALLAVALERVHYVEVAQSATVQMESERLRNSLLAAVSHDLRTPLAAIYGSSELLVQQIRGLSPAAVDLAQGIASGARRMNAMVANLLDMARLQSGSVQLNLQWQPLEEVVGSALQAVAAIVAGHRIVTTIAHDLPLLNFDAVLIERVFCNLLENAAKYTPPGSTVTISARLSGDEVVTTVADDGPGLPPGREEALFEKFARGGARVRDSWRRAGSRDLPCHRRGARRPHLGRRRQRGARAPRRALPFHLARRHSAGPARARARLPGQPRRSAVNESPVAVLIEDDVQIRRFVRSALEARGLAGLRGRHGAARPGGGRHASSRSGHPGSRLARRHRHRLPARPAALVEGACHRADGAIARERQDRRAGCRRRRLHHQALRRRRAAGAGACRAAARRAARRAGRFHVPLRGGRGRPGRARRVRAPDRTCT